MLALKEEKKNKQTYKNKKGGGQRREIFVS